jgi:hypothetical protein
MKDSRIAGVVFGGLRGLGYLWMGGFLAWRRQGSVEVRASLWVGRFATDSPR